MLSKIKNPKNLLAATWRNFGFSSMGACCGFAISHGGATGGNAENAVQLEKELTRHILSWHSTAYGNLPQLVQHSDLVSFQIEQGLSHATAQDMVGQLVFSPVSFAQAMEAHHTAV